MTASDPGLAMEGRDGGLEYAGWCTLLLPSAACAPPQPPVALLLSGVESRLQAYLRGRAQRILTLRPPLLLGQVALKGEERRKLLQLTGVEDDRSPLVSARRDSNEVESYRAKQWEGAGTPGMVEQDDRDNHDDRTYLEKGLLHYHTHLRILAASRRTD